jgi:1-acyl-sn-glycerol-3-phosphate acyltransferase
LFRLLTKVEVTGMDYVRQAKGAILASNHIALLDAPLIFCFLPREDSTALVAKKHQKHLILRILVNAAGGIWLNRDEPDAHALRTAIQYLKNGGILGLAPEGTRSKTGGMARPKTGVAYLADKAGVPIIPAGITGTETVLKRLARFQRPRITLTVGEPFCLPPVRRQEREHDLEENTDWIMLKIAALLPESYRGVYG